MRVWLTSDTHFGHENIIKYCGRPFSTVEEMDKEIIRRWNNAVKKDDIVFHLGDFCLGNKEIVSKMVQQLNGRISLILGNHDRYKSNQYIEMGFAWASRFPIIYDGFYIMSHEPIFLEVNSPFCQIHGHLHQNDYVSPGNQHVNVCVEKTNYTPVLFENIKKRKHEETKN
jgi:calcineurin-like phosphoesterase family protein